MNQGVQISARRQIATRLWRLVYPVALFWSAGTVRWVEAWVFLGMLLVFLISTRLMLRRHDPALLQERLVRRADGPDKIYFLFFLPTFLAWFPILGFDAVRFGWSRAPLWVEVAGGCVTAVGLILLFVVFRTNTFLSYVVRVQVERGQRVIDSGPYSVVRHPMYAAGSLVVLGGSLLLGSYVGAGVAVLMTLMLAVRCLFEERTLAAGLEGYARYKEWVRYRMVPGIW